MPTLRYNVPPEENGCPVRHILKARLHFSARAISRLTRTEGGILRNGQPVRTVDILRAGDTLSVLSSDLRPAREQPLPCDTPLPIVWEDEYLLIVNKPAGMVAMVSSFYPETPTVAGALAYQRGEGGIFHVVNRLDKGTTGLMAVAKSGYVIGRDESSTVKRMIRPDGAPSRSRYEVLEVGNGLALLRLLPETGRTHQLRLHLSAIGHPLAGDWLYGTEDPALIPRPALHSCALRLRHPVTGELLTLTAPLPEDMERLLSPK